MSSDIKIDMKSSRVVSVAFRKVESIIISSIILITIISFTMIVPVIIGSFSEASAQTVTGRPFSEQGGCTSPSTTNDRRRRSCNGSFTWPDNDEESPAGNYNIIKDSVALSEIDRRGDGWGCSLSLIEETVVVDIEGIGPTPVNLVKGATVSYNARGNNNPGVRGRIECRVSGRYSSS